MENAIAGDIEVDLTRLLNESNETSHWSRKGKGLGPHLHQAVLFLKPELTDISRGVDLNQVLQLVLEALTRFSVEIGSVRILTSEYLRKHTIIDHHYGVINRISRQGQSALSETAIAAMESEYKQELTYEATILGGHQFLERFTEFSPLALNVLSNNLGTKKLGGGAYCIKAIVAGKLFLILNPFHPFQLEDFTAPGRAIVVIEALTETPWRILRHDLIGATDPSKAVDGSIRNILLKRRLDIRLSEVSQGTNGVHLSAGPLEGMVEFQRFFSEPGSPILDVSSTSFGQRLVAKGIPVGIIEHLVANVTTPENGALVPVFDLTEECDADQAAEMLSARRLHLEAIS